MKNILLLTQNEAEVYKMENLCNNNQFSLKVALTTKVFIEEITKGDTELIIIDNEFAEVNIVELLKKLKEKTDIDKIPVLILVNKQNRAQLMQLMGLNIKEFLVKPYLTKTLLQKIKEMANIDKISLTTTKSNLSSTGKISLNVIEEAKRKKIIMNEIENLPAFPVIVQKVIQIVNNPKSSAADFEDHVRKDQTLTAKMLRMANSSFYNVKREIILIKDAVVTLGYNTVKTIAFAAGTGDIFKRNLPQYGLAPAGLWKHSFGVALTSRFIALEKGLSDDEAEELFICGLLHDIGKLILGKFIQNEDRVYDIDTKIIPNICEAERVLTGFDHSELGEIITQKWQLPQKIGYGVKYHHNLPQAVDHNDEIAIINLADYICKSLKIGYSKKNKSEPVLSESVLNQLSIDESKITYYQNEISEKLKDLDQIARI